MMLSQQQSADQWAYYQSKVMREHLYRTQKMRLELELVELGYAMKQPVREQYESLAKNFVEEAERYGNEKKKIEEETKALEERRNLNQSKDPYFHYADVLLQIAIVMASISIRSSSRSVF